MPRTGVTTAVNNGYALLFDLLGNEKDLSKLLVAKREREEVRELVKEISDVTGRAHQQLESFARSAGLNLKERGLPWAETETRAAISKTRAKELLIEGGKEFELRLLLSQNEALTYGVHLADTIGRREADPDRAKFLRDLSAELTRLQQKVVAMLLTAAGR